jgi:hypothetical protein
MGQIVLNWQLGGFAAESRASGASMADPGRARSSCKRAGFSGGAVESFDTLDLGSDPSPQPLLIPPPHA